MDEYTQFIATAKRWEARLHDPKVVSRISRFRDAVDQRLVEPMVQQIATKGYYDGCRKLDSEFDLEVFIDIKRMENLTHLTYSRGKHHHHSLKDKVITYDIKPDILEAMSKPVIRKSTMSGAIYAEGSLDRIAHLDIADTYPKTITVTDEEWLERELWVIHGRCDETSST
jgi:hypothetical protein